MLVCRLSSTGSVLSAPMIELRHSALNVEITWKKGGGLGGWWTQKQCVCTREFIKQYAISGASTKLQQTTTSNVKVRPSASNNSAPTWRIFMKFDIWRFFRKICLKIVKFYSILTRIRSTLHEDIFALMILFAGFFLEREMSQARIVEKIKINILSFNCQYQHMHNFNVTS